MTRPSTLPLLAAAGAGAGMSIAGVLQLIAVALGWSPAASGPLSIRDAAGSAVTVPSVSAISEFDVFQQAQAAVGISGLACSIEDGATLGVQCTGEVALAILARRRNGDRVIPLTPPGTDAGVEVDSRLIAIAHGRRRTARRRPAKLLFIR